MRPVIVSILLAATAAGFDQSPLQPAIAPDGVVNAASYISRGFTNQGIARGSLFLIFGEHLGPDTLTQAGSFPLPGGDGLAGTQVHINTGTYTGYALMVYTSAGQVAAILPSNVPEGDAILTLNYRNLGSNAVVIHVVRSAFGAFTLNQAGTGQAIVQKFISQAQTPLNNLLASATPGQTMILWGTGLGPVNGDEASGPLPGALSYLDALYVGGQPANVRFAGRSGCCAGIDQVIFDVPAGVSGCYVPVVAVTNGLVSNSSTIAVSSTGNACDDPLSFRATDLATLQRNGRLRVGTIQLLNQTPAGASAGSATLSGSFISYTPQTLMMAPAAVNPSAGACYMTQSVVNSDPSLLPHGDALNAGFNFMTSGPSGSFVANWVSPGNYMSDVAPTALRAGIYAVSGAGGPDIGPLQANFTVAPAVQWTNAGDYPAMVRTGQPMTFRWTGGDSSGFVTIRIASASVTLSTSIVCNLPASLGTFTVPDYLTRTIIQGPGTISLGSFNTPASFSAAGLDVGDFTAQSSTVVQTSFQLPPGASD